MTKQEHLSEPVKSRIHQGRNSYCPPTKLYLSTCGPHVTITHDALHLLVQPFPPPPDIRPEDPRPSPASPRHRDQGTPPPPPPHPPLPVTSDGHYWKPVQTCTLDLTVQPPPPRETTGGCLRNYGQRKRAVRILLECFLVLNSVNFTFIKGNDT